MHLGDPIQGEIHSSDASAGVEATLYPRGSQTARTLAANEYIEIDSLEVVVAETGDVHVFFSTSATPPTGGTIARGTVGVNGGIVQSINLQVGLNNQNVWLIAPAGAADLKFSGRIRIGESQGIRPSWQSALTPAGNVSAPSTKIGA